MKRLLAIAIATAVVTFASSAESQAQVTFNSVDSGYNFGVGQRFARGFQRNFLGGGGFNGGGFGFGRIGISPRLEEPPYFAKFPPVYYSGIVRRPYGISPFAAPPGIAPVELSVPVEAPVTIQNPYFNNPVAPVQVQEPVPAAPTDLDNKSTSIIVNPYMESFTSNE